MSNMPYVRFENTLRDLRDCSIALERLKNNDAEKLSESELTAAKQLATECRQLFCDLSEDAGMNECIADFGDDEIEDVIDAYQNGVTFEEQRAQLNSLRPFFPELPNAFRGNKIEIDFDTDDFERSHGSLPRGRGSWAFGLRDGTSNWNDAMRAVFSPGNMTLAEAKKWLRENIPEQWKIDSEIEVGVLS